MDLQKENLALRVQLLETQAQFLQYQLSVIGEKYAPLKEALDAMKEEEENKED